MQDVPDWFDNMFALQIALWIAILVLVIGTMVKLWKPAKRFIQGVDTLFGTTEDTALANRLRRMEQQQETQGTKIETIRAQVLPNHGSSLRDRVDQVSAKVDELAEFQQRDYDRLREHLTEAEQAKAVIETIADKVEVITDGKGGNNG